MKYLNVSITYKIKHLSILQKVFRAMYFQPNIQYSRRQMYLRALIQKALTIRMCKEELKVIVKIE